MQEMQETGVRSLGGEDPLEKGMATHYIQYSCLGNPMDRGAWWAIVNGVVKEWDMTEPSCTGVYSNCVWNHKGP